MNYFLVRHAETDGTRFTKDNFGPLGAPLNEAGKLTSIKLNELLKSRNVDFDQEVAVSELQRTQQTARLAGFHNLVINPLLNEIDGEDPAIINADIANRRSSEFAITAANKIINNPPLQKFWFTHGQVTAALLDLLGYDDREDYVLGFGQIFEIEI